MDLIDIVEAIRSLGRRIDAIDLTTRSRRQSTISKISESLLARCHRRNPHGAAGAIIVARQNVQPPPC